MSEIVAVTATKAEIRERLDYLAGHMLEDYLTSERKADIARDGSI